MKLLPFQHAHRLLAAAALTLTVLAGSSKAQTILLFEDWQDAEWSGGDINVAPNDDLSDFVGYGLNNNNPTTLLGAGTGGNVLRDQGGFGGTYGDGANTGNAVRVRSSNGAMLNKNPLLLESLGASSVTFSFDLKQNQANYVQVVEFSSDQAFTAPILLDTFDGNTDLGVWIAKSYTLVKDVDTPFTNNCYFRIRKLRPSPANTNGGANSTYHVYDNLKISAETGPATQFAITAFAYDPDTDKVTLTWTSSPNKSYIAKYSTDMVDWSNDLRDSLTIADDLVPDDGDQITVDFTLTSGTELNSDLFFRIEEE